MVATLVRLKLSLLRNALRRSVWRTVGLILGLVYALGVVVLALAGLIALRWTSVELTADVTVLAFTALTAGWLLLSLLVFGIDETLDPARFALATRVLAKTLTPLGAWAWDGSGDNPYFGMLALADAIIVTVDSVSMVSEAVATSAPVMLADLPGHSRRNALFTEGLMRDGRVRAFAGRLEIWPVAPLDDTPAAAAEMCRRLGLTPC